MRSGRHGFRRHDLVWLDGTRWRGALRSPLADTVLPTIDAWFSNGRPAVVRRHDGVATQTLSLGVALPSTCAVRKIPLQVDLDVVRHTTPPLSLTTVIPSAPSSWRAELARLAAGAHAVGVDLRVYGSLVWQHVSGEPYVTPTSDVDLLWRARDQAMLQNMLEHLAQWERTSGLAADGELLLHDDTAVAWKELLHRPRQLLIKRTNGVELRAYEEALRLIPPALC